LQLEKQKVKVYQQAWEQKFHLQTSLQWIFWPFVKRIFHSYFAMFASSVTLSINIFQLCFVNVKKRELGYFINTTFIIGCRNYITKVSHSSNNITGNGKKKLVFKDINYKNTSKSSTLKGTLGINSLQMLEHLHML